MLLVFDRARADGFIGQKVIQVAAVFRVPHFVCACAVSYTHLDVYKRQVYNVLYKGENAHDEVNALFTRSIKNEF